MAGTKEYFFRPDSLLRLLTHYTDGVVPMGAIVTDFLVNPYLTRVIGLMTQSDEWDTPEALHIRYDGKRIASWKQDGSAPQMHFEERNETPKLQ